MKQADFITKRSGEWRWMEDTLGLPRRGFSGRASSFPAAYRRVVRDLNTARSENFDPYLVERLDRMVVDGHARLYGSRRLRLRPLADFISTGFPGIVRRDRKLLGVFAAVFFGVTVFTGIMVHENPWMFAEWFSEETASQVAEMYNPESRQFLTPRNVSGDADMFGYYIYNNISISFQVFAGGILAGFGSLLMLAYNALFIGATAGYLTSLGYGITFYPFITGHGTVELLAVIFSGAAGWRMGWALLRPPGRLGRKDGLRRAAGRALPLVYGSVFFLVLAACIEAFWSSRPLPPTVKYIFGGAMAAMVLSYFIFSGRSGDE